MLRGRSGWRKTRLHIGTRFATNGANLALLLGTKDASYTLGTKGKGMPCFWVSTHSTGRLLGGFTPKHATCQVFFAPLDSVWDFPATVQVHGHGLTIVDVNRSAGREDLISGRQLRPGLRVLGLREEPPQLLRDARRDPGDPTKPPQRPGRRMAAVETGPTSLG